MKNLFLLISFFITSIAFGQTFDPNTGTVSNRPYSPAQGVPTDNRSYFYDSDNFVWRAYVSTAEVLSYLNLAKYRTGQFAIIVNTGGTLSNGVITGGTNAAWWFKNGTADSNLVPIQIINSVNGQTGTVITKNADSLRGLPVDTTNNTNGYVVTFDKVNKKLILKSPGGVYTAGVGIDITDGVVSALNNSALWNAIQLRSRPISTTVPQKGQFLGFDGLAWTPNNLATDSTQLDTAYYNSDTLYLAYRFDTIKVYIPTGGGGSVAGSNKQIQFNDNGVFGAQAGFEYDKSINTLSSDTIKGVRLNLISEDTIPQLVITHPRDSASVNPIVLFKNDIGDTTFEIRSSYGLRNGLNVSSTFIGHQSGSHNVFNSNTSGRSNTGLGAVSLRDNISGVCNTAIGARALQSNVSGSFNNAFGEGALGALVSGEDNIGFGQASGFAMTSGSENVFIGNNSGNNVTSGNKNVFIGRQSGPLSGTGSRNVFIGYKTGSNEVNPSRRLFIHDTSGANPLIYGEFDNSILSVSPTDAKFGIRTKTPEQALHVKGQVKIDTLTTGSGTDSLVVSSNGVLKKILRSSVYSPTLQDVTTAGNTTNQDISTNSIHTTSTTDTSFFDGPVRIKDTLKLDVPGYIGANKMVMRDPYDMNSQRVPYYDPSGSNKLLSSSAFSFLNSSRLQVRGPVNSQFLINNITTNRIMTNIDSSRAIFTNAGASGLITITLPSAAAGYDYIFLVENTNGIRITAASGDVIRTGDSVTTSGGSITSYRVGQVIRLVAINATEWVQINNNGSSSGYYQPNLTPGGTITDANISNLAFYEIRDSICEVTASFSATVSTSSTGSGEIFISLPTSTDITSSVQLLGTASSLIDDLNRCLIFGDASTDQAKVMFDTKSLTNSPGFIIVNFKYKLW